jgi:sulfotransferase family protein
MDPIIFPLVDEAVLHWHRRHELMQRLIPLYCRKIALAGASIYVDKSHQNIWLVEWLNRAFPAARYIAIERMPYATISSMMLHHGVRCHFVYWRNYPLPNRHLGIKPTDATFYDNLPLSLKCALRWRSHHERLIELTQTLGERLNLIRYERLVQHTNAEINKLAAFVGRPLQSECVKQAPLEKWRKVLSLRQRTQIDQVLAMPASASNLE